MIKNGSVKSTDTRCGDNSVGRTSYMKTTQVVYGLSKDTSYTIQTYGGCIGITFYGSYWLDNQFAS